ncbi:MAG: SRPBCC family protein [Longimicrobiales bacterium]
MPQVVASTQVNTGPEAIWALMCDPHRYPEIADPTERMIDVPDREFGVGYVYKEYGGIKPFMGESEWRVTEFEPMRRQVHIGDDGSMTLNLEIGLTPADSGTRLTQTLIMKPRWYLAPVNAILWPLMMRKRAQEGMDKTVANVKRIAESSG